MESFGFQFIYIDIVIAVINLEYSHRQFDIKGVLRILYEIQIEFHLSFLPETPVYELFWNTIHNIDFIYTQ